MNEKFFDLKKDKQDRIINAAIKIFATNGYRHSSTDDIVKEAGISKGLLFHYFGSKIRLYEFLYDYCVKFLTLELGNSIQDTEKELLSHGRLSSLSIHATQSGDVLLDYAVKPPQFERIQRITGYLFGTTDCWNNGKKAEMRDRVKHSLEIEERGSEEMSL